MNDLLITRSNESYIRVFKHDMMKDFEKTYLGNISYFLSLELHRSAIVMLMHQRRYVVEILDLRGNTTISH